MSRRQLVEHTWYSDCRICGKRITARTQVVLDQLAEAHFKECRDKAIKKIEERKAEAAQGDLFGKPKP
jgi:hypothetical protein